MKKVNGTLFLLLLCFSISALAQTYDVPRYHFTSKTNFSEFEPEVIKATDWLQRTHWSAKDKKLDAASQFVLDWAQGTPNVTIQLRQSIMDLSDANPQLGFIYIAHYCKYAILHQYEFDKDEASVYALKAVIAKYQMEPGHKYDKDVERLIEMDKDIGLLNWVKDSFSFE
ncbi:hypothetical protein ACFQZX_03130 [Mucilaginibacter litoreus]|uniref:DUF4034 domain-containing protein n=1 Tax=Mucilaginibacter litoreus TaxID=1048221 RepID=A0ABW3ANJ7_9SPHI